MLTRLSGLFAALAVISYAASAFADTACPSPTQADANNAILKVYGFTPPAATVDVWYRIGQTTVSGTSVIAACIEYVENGINKSTLRTIRDSNDQRLTGLPKTYNHLCLTAKNDHVA